jgi:peptide chain release factor 1
MRFRFDHPAGCISDQKRYVQLNQEYKTLKALAEKRDEYVMITYKKKQTNHIRQ